MTENSIPKTEYRNQDSLAHWRVFLTDTNPVPITCFAIETSRLNLTKGGEVRPKGRHFGAKDAVEAVPEFLKKKYFKKVDVS